MTVKPLSLGLAGVAALLVLCLTASWGARAEGKTLAPDLVKKGNYRGASFVVW